MLSINFMSPRKINIVDRLSRHLSDGTPASASISYLDTIRKRVPAHPVIHIDDSDVVKLNDYKFEAIGTVRDGSAGTVAKNIYKKVIMSLRHVKGGYHGGGIALLFQRED